MNVWRALATPVIKHERWRVVFVVFVAVVLALPPTVAALSGLSFRVVLIVAAFTLVVVLIASFAGLIEYRRMEEWEDDVE